MKKVIGIIFGLMIGCFGLVFSACDPNYDNLSLVVLEANNGQVEEQKLEKIKLAVGETAEFNFKVENAPSNYNFQVELNEINNLFTVVSSNNVDNKLHYTIQGVKTGITTVQAITYEGGKTCSFDVEVYKNVEEFSVKGVPYVVVSEGNSYILKNQHYFTFEPQNCKEPDVKFTYENQEVVEIRTVQDGGKTVLKLITPDGSFLKNTLGQDESFMTGNISLTAQILNYDSATIADIAPINLPIKIVPQIDIGKINILQRGASAKSTPTYYTDKSLTDDTVIKLIKNQINDCYMIFEVECNTPDVIFDISSDLCEYTQITLLDIGNSIKGYEQPEEYQYCKFFAIQALDVGKDVVNIELSYSDNTSYSQTEYKETFKFNVEIITAPHTIAVNNLTEFEDPISIFDNAKTATSFAVTVLDKLSNFESISVALTTEDEDLEYVEDETLYNYLKLTYRTDEAKTSSFNIDYKEFVSNSLSYPIKLQVLDKYADVIYLSIKVNLIDVFDGEGTGEDNVVEINVPIKIEEGIRSFSLQPEYQNEDKTIVMSRTLYMDIDVEEYDFNGFVIVNDDTALLSDFKFDYKNNSDQLFEVKQVYEDNHRTKQLKIYPKALGEGVVRVIAQEGFYQDLKFCVCKSLDEANLVLVKNKDVTKTSTDANENIKSIEVAFDGGNNISFLVIKNNNDANLYNVTCAIESGKTSIVDVVYHKDCELTLQIYDITDSAVTLTVNIVLQEITNNFEKINKVENGIISFDVAITSYSPIKNLSFQNESSAVSGISLYRSKDVGFKYIETLAQSSVTLNATQKNGNSISNILSAYAKNISFTTSYGDLEYVKNEDKYLINNFGSMKIDGDNFTFICDNEEAMIGGFVFAITIVDHNVSFTAQLTITVKSFTALEYIGISNYQDTLYLSGKQDSFTFYTFMDPNADIKEFDVVYESSNLNYENLFKTSVNNDFTEVTITHPNSTTLSNKNLNESGYIYFVPRTLFVDAQNNFPKDKVQKIKVVYSDGSQKEFPELISNAEEFMEAMTSSTSIAKHYLILSTIDLKNYSYEDFAKIKNLSGSISGGNSNAKIVNINLSIDDTNYTNSNIGLFPMITETGEINDISFEGTLNIQIDNVGQDKMLAVGLVAGQNLGKLNNVSVTLNTSNVVLESKGTSNSIFIGGIAGINYGEINNGVDAIGTKKSNSIIFNFDDTKINLTAINALAGIEAKNIGVNTENGFGGIVGKNLGTINRENSNAKIYNNNNYTALVNLSVSGFDATGGVAGINGEESNNNSVIKNQCVMGDIKSHTQDTKGGTNCGGVVGKNYAYLQNSITRATVFANDYVGGLIGYDETPEYVLGNTIQAVKNANYSPMISALSPEAHTGAICGNETGDINSIYMKDDANNKALVYYSMDSSKKIVPILYALENKKFNSSNASIFKESSDSLKITGINVSSGTQKLVISDDSEDKFANKIANMFIYQAEDSTLQQYIDYKNENRDIPFNFDCPNTIIIDSLSPEILTVDSYGNISIYNTGLATLKVTSVLDTTQTSYVYVYVSNAFDELIVSGGDGNRIATNSFLNIYNDSTSNLQSSFTQTLTDIIGESGQKINVQLVDAYIPSVEISSDAVYTSFSQYGNLAIFSAKNVGQTGSDSVTLSTKYVINLQIAGQEVSASLDDFSFMGDNSTFDIKVCTLTGTKTITTDISDADIQPVDELIINVTQITDDVDEQTFKEIKFVKFSDDADVNNTYFVEPVPCSKVRTEITNESGAVVEYKNEYIFTFKYNFTEFSQDYEGQYYIVFVAKNGTSASVLVNLQTQQLENIVLKNYYDVDTTTSYNPANLQSTQISSGANNVLQISIYPYFSDYDYLIIQNDESNAEKNNTILMELVDEEFNFIDGVIYEDGIKITKDTLETLKNVSEYANLIDANTGIANILIKYTTVSKATVDSIAKVNIFAIKENQTQEIVMQRQLVLNVVAMDSVYFTIDAREQANEYYLAKGLTYDLTLNIHGFTEDQMQVEILHEGYSTTAVQLQKENNKYQLVINSNVSYASSPSSSSNKQGYEVEITTYGRYVVDGKEIRSGDSTLKIIIVDFAILQENIGNYNHNNDITKFDQKTSISLSSGAVVSLPVGSNYQIKNKFVNGVTIEYDSTNAIIENKVKSFENDLTTDGAWTITANDINLGVLGKFVQTLNIDDNTSLKTNYLKLENRTLTPLRVNNYKSSTYYLSYEGGYKYANGVPTYASVSSADVFSLSTDFVFDIYQNSTLENAIPIYSYQELCEMQANAHYILLKDITLPTDFVPLTTQIASLDGNGYSITLPSSLAFSDGEQFGIFESVGEDMILKNIKIKVNTTTVTINTDSSIYYGVLAGENNGTITNCCVEGSNYGQISVSIPNQNAEAGLMNNYVCGLVAINNGYITNSHVSVNLTAVANVSGFVGINNKKISSSYVRDSMIVNKSSASSIHKTAGFVIRNGSTGAENTVISSCYVCGTTNKSNIYSVSTTKALSSMPSVAGFVYSNYSAIQDCYSDIVINSSANCAGFVFENSGNVERAYSTSTFTCAGQETFVFVKSNKIETNSTGSFEDCFCLVGVVNEHTNKLSFSGIKLLSDYQFALEDTFSSYAISSNTSKTDGVWFYPSQNEETSFIKDDKNMLFTYGKLELVAPNIITNSQKELTNTTVDSVTGGTNYEYYEKLSAIGDYRNPIIISSATAFEKYIVENSYNNINSMNYRLVADIDYRNENVLYATTYNTILTGTFEGNNMNISGYSINSRAKATYGGLFAQIGQKDANSGIVKNLNLIPYYINLPNVSCVGSLAGYIEGGKVFNITCDGFYYDANSSVKVIGKNAVGGVIGYATNGFVIRNVVSSISANASYDHTKSQNNFMLYQNTSNLNYVSYVGSVVGIATKIGIIQNISAQNKCFVIGEVAGLLVGQVGTYVEFVNITQQVEEGQKVIATVYGGGLVGELNGEITNATIDGVADKNFFQQADTQLAPATAVGGLVGLCLNGEISSSAVAINLEWSSNSPSIIGGVVGEMLGGTLSATSYQGEKITINAINTNSSITEMISGGMVGKISANLSVITDSSVNAGDVTIQFCSTSGLMTVNLTNVMSSYIGGIVGQVINTFLESDTQIEETSGTYKTKTHYVYVLNGDENEMDISASYVVYSGVLTRYVHGLVGAVFSDSTKLYEGEIIVYDEDDGLKYASSMNCKITLSITNSRNATEIEPEVDANSDTLSEDLRYGYFVTEQTEVEGKYSAKINPWGKLLAKTSKDTVSIILDKKYITLK